MTLAGQTVDFGGLSDGGSVAGMTTNDNSPLSRMGSAHAEVAALYSASHDTGEERNHG